MHSLNFVLRYRPIRIGWCIRAGDTQALRQSIRASLTMCGGAHNPLIAVDDQEGAARLVTNANVDLLLAVRQDDAISAFVNRFDTLPSWTFHEHIFEGGPPPSIPRPAYLDIVMAARYLVATELAKQAKPPVIRLFEWAEDDPLGDLLLVNFGGLPRQGEPGSFVKEQLRETINTALTTVGTGEVVALPDEGDRSLRVLADLELEYDLWGPRGHPTVGFFIAESDSFWDLLNFWNIRAAGSRLLMYNAACADRLQLWRDDLTRRLSHREPSTRPEYPRIVFARPGAKELSSGWLPEGMMLSHYDTTDRHHVVEIPRLYYEEHNALANLDTESGKQSAVMPLPPRPFRPRRFDDRNVALSVQTRWGPYGSGGSTFQTPNLPILNTYYGREMGALWSDCRVESRGITFLQHYNLGSLTLRSLDVVSLIREILKRIGIPTEVSQAGLVSARVIAQMGKLDNCRPFRVRGLRKLIEDTRPESTFTRSGAIQKIREEGDGGSIGFDRYNDLHIEPPPARLTPDSVFKYMVSHGAFRVGLEFHCPECSLNFWISLDNATAEPECEFCGKRFDATPQLRDRDWRYRRSGVFGKADSQEGAIPVALTLLRFLHSDSSSRMLYAPALTLLPGNAIRNKCETDFVALLSYDDYRRSAVQLAIGECKTRKDITEQDVSNLSAVADVLESNGIEAYVVFSKLADFSDAELMLINEVNSGGRERAIVLTERELQHWFPYKWAEGTPGRRNDSTFADFAAASTDLYLRPAAERSART